MPQKKATVSKDLFKGRPVVVIQFEGDTRPFRFGAGKARRLLAAPAKALREMAETVVQEAAVIDAAEANG